MLLHSTPYYGTWVGHGYLQVHPLPYAWAWARTHFSTWCPTMRVSFCSFSSEDGEAQFLLAVCVSSFLASNLLACISIFSDWNFWHLFFFRFICSQFLFYMFTVQIESPIRVLTADMFATLSTTFELPLYVADLAHLLAEAPSPPLCRTHSFHKLVLDSLNIEAKQGEDSDRHGNPSCWLRFVHLEPPSHMYCLCLRFLYVHLLNFHVAFANPIQLFFHFMLMFDFNCWRQP